MNHNNPEKVAVENCTENMKSRLDTNDLGAIMGRFRDAVTWRAD
jgi:hypothetical protein